jgi:hypothetical protein
MNHALLGASIPFLVALALYLRRGGRASLRLLILTPLAMTFMALWASAPDLPRALGFHDLYLRLSFDPRINIFLWHYTIDQIETESSWYSAGIVLEAAALMAAAIRELRREERS